MMNPHATSKLWRRTTMDRATTLQNFTPVKDAFSMPIWMAYVTNWK